MTHLCLTHLADDFIALPVMDDTSLNSAALSRIRFMLQVMLSHAMSTHMRLALHVSHVCHMGYMCALLSSDSTSG